MNYVYAALVAVAIVAIYIHQDGLHESNDGRRYCSGKPQPPPFNRRWCGWPRWLLRASMLVGFVAIGTMTGSPLKAALLLTLPGAWFASTNETVDLPCIALAWGCALLFPTHPVLAVALSCVGGYLHERAPVFAALYTWSVWPLLGLLAVGWWRKPAPRDGDHLVGWPTLRETIAVHRRYVDLLSGETVIDGLRGALAWAVWAGCPLRAWAAVAVAFGSRIVGTDSCRFLAWGAVPLVMLAPEPPVFVVAASVVLFRRRI